MSKELKNCECYQRYKRCGGVESISEPEVSIPSVDKICSIEDTQIVTVDDFDQKYFPEYFKCRQKEEDYRESSAVKEGQFLVRLFSSDC